MEATRTGRSSLVETAYRELKRRITENVYPPDHRMLESDLARELGMSRTPVREALIGLEKDGLIELLPRRGMRVLPLTVDDMREIYDALTCLETAAVEMVARRRPGASELRPLETALANMKAALEARDLDAWAMADERFHRTLISMCGNSRIARMSHATWDQVRRARHLSLRLVPFPTQSYAEHESLLEAIRRGDVEQARSIHHGQRVRASARIVEVLNRFHLERV